MKQPKKKTALLALMIVIQAVCLLLYPVGVRRMVDVGVRQSGFHTAVPERLREQTLEDLRLFMTPEDYKTVHDAYAIENGVCTLQNGQDRAALSAVFAPAARLYLRVQQKGGNAMNAVRVAMENGTMTQSQLLQMAKEGLNEDLSPAQARMAAVPFLRAEYSVLGADPNAIRAAYLRNVTFLLLGCAVLAYLAGMAEQRLRRENEARLPDAQLLAAAGGIALAVWGLIDLVLGWVKPGAFFLLTVALTQLAMLFVPVALPRRGDAKAPDGRAEMLRCVLPAALGGVGAVLAVVGTAIIAETATAVNAGLNRVLASTGGIDRALALRSLLPGGALLLVGLGGMIGAQLLSRKQTLAYSGAVGTALEILPGFAGMVAALVVIFSKRFWLGVLVLLALGCAVALMALVQNRRPGRVAASVRLPGQIACAALAGLGANLAARSTITLGGYLACVLCAVISTRAAARLLTRR